MIIFHVTKIKERVLLEHVRFLVIPYKTLKNWLYYFDAPICTMTIFTWLWLRKLEGCFGNISKKIEEVRVILKPWGSKPPH